VAPQTAWCYELRTGVEQRQSLRLPSIRDAAESNSGLQGSFKVLWLVDAFSLDNFLELTPCFRFLTENYVRVFSFFFARNITPVAPVSLRANHTNRT
jgi:hypothetical protein